MPTKDNINSTWGNNPVQAGTIDLYQSGVPVALIANGTVATNGIVTTGTAFSRNMLGCWIHLPAGAVVGGAQGFYWCVFTSTTVGQVYTNYAADGALAPYIPVGPLVPAVGSNSAYTSVTNADIVAATGTVPGGFLGPNGLFLAEGFVEHNSSGGAKIFRVLYDTVTFVDISVTTSLSDWFSRYIWNRGDVAQQMSQPATVYNQGNSSVTAVTGSVNSNADKSMSYVLRKATATDWAAYTFIHVHVYSSI